VTTESITAMQRRLRATAWIAAAVITVSTALNGLPSDGADATAVVIVTAVSLVLWLAGSAVDAKPLVAAVTTATGLGGAALIWLQPSGPGDIVAFMAMAGLGLRLSRPLAIRFGGLVLVTAAATEGLTATHPVSGILNIVLGAGFLLLASAYAAASNDSHNSSLELLREQAATRAAVEEAAALAERGRLARELHDVLAHTLSGLALQLEGARLLAEKTDADPQLTEQIGHAGRLAREGLTGAKRAVSTLRGDALPGAADLPALVDNACRSGLLVSYDVVGEPRPLAGETGLAVYRSVQEALTNATKHAGVGASVTVTLTWTESTVTAEVFDSGGGATDGLPSGGFGLAGLGERAALVGGRLEAGPSDGGWRVRLEMPASLVAS
jgi:signal transduction histidine kinase